MIYEGWYLEKSLERYYHLIKREAAAVTIACLATAGALVHFSRGSFVWYGILLFFTAFVWYRSDRVRKEYSSRTRDDYDTARLLDRGIGSLRPARYLVWLTGALYSFFIGSMIEGGLDSTVFLEEGRFIATDPHLVSFGFLAVFISWFVYGYACFLDSQDFRKRLARAREEDRAARNCAL